MTGNVSELHTRTGPSRLPSPIFVAFAAATALGGWMAWTGESRFGVFLFVFCGWIVSLCLHEFGHAYLAYRSGDHSVAIRGYLTLNPFKYGDVALSIVLPLLFLVLGGIGLPGGAVYVNRGAIRGRLRQSLISAAGPLANLIFAVALAAVISRLSEPEHAYFWAGAAFLAYLQVTATVLNLLPVPGLDGFGIIEPYLPERWRRTAQHISMYGLIAVFALLWFPAVNSAFFGLLLHVSTWFGIDPLYTGFGQELFRFWSE
ncbi:MAG: site-2 protease family protein [Streptosporangiales bacterium]|nr:site-2 protease family protein [Streptosporangiales bacterium]